MIISKISGVRQKFIIEVLSIDINYYLFCSGFFIVRTSQTNWEIEMVKILQVREFVWKSEIGRGWIYPTIEEAEKELGWFFLHNCCKVK